MSTTDTRAAFEAWMREEYGADDDMLKRPYEDRYFWPRAADAWAGWQAATEAAKATGTAGELPELPIPAEIHGWPKPPTGQPLYSFDQMREYGQACAEAARSLAISQADYNRDMDELAQDFEPVANMDLLKAKLHIVGLRKRLKNVKAKAEAARQPAPDRQVIEGEFAIQVEKLLCKALGREWSATGISIESLVAALAATAAPALSDEQYKKLEYIAHWMDSSVRYIQNAPDDCGPASQFDYDMGEAAHEILTILAATRSQP